jgi:hypothetical protein
MGIIGLNSFWLSASATADFGSAANDPSTHGTRQESQRTTVIGRRIMLIAPAAANREKSRNSNALKIFPPLLRDVQLTAQASSSAA